MTGHFHTETRAASALQYTDRENAHEGDPVNTGAIMNLIVAQYK